jgi:hypothetical protein
MKQKYYPVYLVFPEDWAKCFYHKRYQEFGKMLRLLELVLGEVFEKTISALLILELILQVIVDVFCTKSFENIHENIAGELGVFLID